MHYRSTKCKTLVCDAHDGGYDDGLEPNSPSLPIDDNAPLNFDELATLHKFSLNDNTIEVLVDATTIVRQQSQWMCNHTTQLERTCKYCLPFTNMRCCSNKAHGFAVVAIVLNGGSLSKTKIIMQLQIISSNKVHSNTVSSTTMYSDNILSNSNKHFGLSTKSKCRQMW